MAKSKRNFFRYLLRFFLFLILLFFGSSIGSVILFKWINPPITSFMLQSKISAIFTKDKSSELFYDWVDYDNISKSMRIAVVASEDQNFPNHYGFDIEAIEKALEKNIKGRRVRGASTISQQVAKNMFLWSGKTYIRKGLEAYFTVLIEFIWGKKRILEVYLNIAQFGDMVYGSEAAAQKFFNRSSAKLTRAQSALLAAVLPNPVRYSAKRPSKYVLKRQSWIIGQISSLGGYTYIQDL